VSEAAYIGPEEPKRRLHPLTPLLESMRLLVAVVLASSWQMFVRESITAGVVLAVGAGLVGAAGGFLSWLYTGYRVHAGELHITEGVIVRRSRTLALERLQGIEVAQPLRARIFGLAQLRIEVAGANETEAPLSYLKLDEAQALRERLLALSVRERAEQVGADVDEDEAAEDAEPAVSPIATVPTGRLIGSTVLEVLPPAVIMLGIFLGGLAAVDATLRGMDVEGRVGMFALVPLLFAIGATLVQMVGTILRNWGFGLQRVDGRLRIERGLTEKHSNVVPLERVTAVSVQLPLLWRLFGWRRVEVSTASIAQQGTEGMARGADLLPVGPTVQAHLVADTALPGIAWDQVPESLIRPPRRARWRVPFTWHVRGAGLGEQVFAVRYGLFRTTTVAVPYARIQEVEVTQGPLQRLQRLATVRAKIAGSVAHDAVALHRDAAEAVAIAAELRERADAAAAVERPRLF
jgi:putative membrane protein